MTASSGRNRCGRGPVLPIARLITKMDPAGPALVYSTFLGETNIEFTSGLAVQAAGSACITGASASAGPS